MYKFAEVLNLPKTNTVALIWSSNSEIPSQDPVLSSTGAAVPNVLSLHPMLD